MGATSRRILNALLGQTVVYTLYPVPGAGGATIAGLTVTSGAGAWGADKEIIAALAIANEFWVCAVDVDTFAGGAVQPVVGMIEIAAATEVFSFRFDPTAVTTNIGRFGLPFPRWIPGGSQITAKISGAAARTLNVSVLVATGL